MVNSIENYNRNCLVYYYNQLYGDWTGQCSIRSSGRDQIYQIKKRLEEYKTMFTTLGNVDKAIFLNIRFEDGEVILF